MTAHLDQWGVDHHTLLTDQVGVASRTSIRTSSKPTEISGHDLDWNQIHSVWNRRIFVDPGWSTDPGPDPMLDKHVHDQRLAMVQRAAAAAAATT